MEAGKMRKNIPAQLRTVWSSTRYDSPELTDFARQKTVEEARRGLVAMSILTIVILLIEGALYVRFALDPMYLYTCAVLVLLSLNMLISARSVADPQALHLLGITLLVVSGAMLFIVIPMMSWGLGEALAVTLLIYTMFTLSTIDARYDFADQSLWTLQFIMIGASAVSLSLVARNVKLRKHDVETQHDLVVAHERITDLSNRDPLTGAWNRRYFDDGFEQYLEDCRRQQHQFQFMLLDVDDFKIINDVCGHENGDLLLQNIGQAFISVLAGNGTLVRMGGDEFAVIFADLDPRVIATRAVKMFNDLNAVSKFDEMARASLSFGVASVPPYVELSYRQIYKQADLALYRAKSLKDAVQQPPNIIVSELHNPDEAQISTQTLWNQDDRKDISAAGNSGR
jgi:diguanylate cyclase (GGDEF)-like protein